MSLSSLDCIKMDALDFYILQRSFLLGETSVRPLNDKMDFVSLFREGKVSTPIEFKVTSGKRLYDLMGTEFSGLFLISKKVVEVLRNEKVTGWKTYEAVLYTAKASLMEQKYWGLSVTGKCGALSPKGVRLIEKVNPHGYKYKVRCGLNFDQASWDSSEIFSPEGTMLTLVTGRVKSLLTGFSNFSFTRIEDFEMPEF